jgi:hypothetical protein
MYWEACLQPCGETTISVPEFYIDGELKIRNVRYDVSDCCEAGLSRDYPGVLCVACDEPATVRCTHCGEWHCAACFGADRAEASGPCHECAVNLAREGEY